MSTNVVQEVAALLSRIRSSAFSVPFGSRAQSRSLSLRRRCHCAGICVRITLAAATTMTAVVAAVIVAGLLTSRTAFAQTAQYQAPYGLHVTDLYLDLPTAPVTTPPTDDAAASVTQGRLKLEWNTIYGVANLTVVGLARIPTNATTWPAWTTMTNTSVLPVPCLPSGAVSVSNYNASTNTAIDDSWASGVRYAYFFYGYTRQGDGPTYSYTAWNSGPLFLTPCAAAATIAATADSRMDKRFSELHYKDFTFNKPPVTNVSGNGPWLYRGGLYAGHNGDESQVGRSYLKFPLSATTGRPAGSVLPVGHLYAYCTRLARSGASASVVASLCASPLTASAPTVVWTTAPAPAGTATGAINITYDSAAPAARWRYFDTGQLLSTASQASGAFDLMLKSSSENNGSGWAYFARNEYHTAASASGGYGPLLLWVLEDSMVQLTVGEEQ